jgi:hypothetical protein
VTCCYFVNVSLAVPLTDGLFPGTRIVIMNERMDERAAMSAARFKSLTRGRCGLIRLGPCPDCGKMGVYHDGRVVHDPDFDAVEEVMES